MFRVFKDMNNRDLVIVAIGGVVLYLAVTKWEKSVTAAVSGGAGLASGLMRARHQPS